MGPMKRDGGTRDKESWLVCGISLCCDHGDEEKTGGMPAPKSFVFTSSDPIIADSVLPAPNHKEIFGHRHVTVDGSSIPPGNAVGGDVTRCTGVMVGWNFRCSMPRATKSSTRVMKIAEQ